MLFWTYSLGVLFNTVLGTSLLFGILPDFCFGLSSALFFFFLESLKLNLNLKFGGVNDCSLLSVNSFFFSVADLRANLCPSHFAGKDDIFFLHVQCSSCWIYRVRQKYLTILQNSCERNRWRGEFVLERSSSESQSIWIAMERWSVEHRAFAVETYFKNNDSVLTQRIFHRHFNIHRNKCP